MRPMSYDDDPPTRRLPVPPREPVGPREPREPLPPREPPLRDPAYVAQPVAGVADAQLLAMEERLSALRSWLVALAVLSLLALGVAAWALLSSEDSGSGSGSSRSTASLREDVAKLEERIGDRATKGDLSDVRSDVNALQTSVDDAAKAQDDAPDTDAASTADVDALEQDVQTLQDRVEELESAPPAADEGATDGTTDGTTAP